MTENGTLSSERTLTTIDRVRAIVDEVIAGTPVFVVDLTLRGRAGSQVVDVFLDSDEPLGIGALARLSREIGFVLETEDVIRGRYHLNVSSPGADRPLVDARQYAKHVGRSIRVTLNGSEPGSAGVEGELARVETGTIVLRLRDGAERPVPFDDIKEATVQLPW